MASAPLTAAQRLIRLATFNGEPNGIAACMNDELPDEFKKNRPTQIIRQQSGPAAPLQL